MFSIKHVNNNLQHSNYVELISTHKKSCARIYLNLGASMQELILDDNSIITNPDSSVAYEETYASSILFPFANRIKDGAYIYNDKAYQFEINRKDENNALHGSVYNKTFKIIKENTSENSASITLEYNEIKKVQGFPFTYKVQLNYVLTNKKLNLNVAIKNTSNEPFPFTIGWHPYFASSNLTSSVLTFNSDEKIILDERNITKGTDDFQSANYFEIKDQKLDDCFVLNSDTIKLKTPDYQLEISTTGKEKFLQIYKPSKANTIAIEPTTGVSNSFNNKIGLQILNAKSTFEINWSVKLTNSNNNVTKS